MSFIGNNPKLTTIKFNARSSAPSSPTEGMIYYDDGTTNSEGFYKYQNSVWEPIGSNADYMKLNSKAADPSSPVEGQFFYANGTSRPEGLYVYNGSEWLQVQLGTSGINYISNSSFEGGTTGWSLYADAAQSTPENGTGGSATSTLTASTSSPLRGLKSLLFSKPASNEQGEGFSYDFTIDSADKNNVLEISFDYDASSANYADDYMSIFIYDVTNSQLIRFNGEELKGKTNGKFLAFFQASQSTSYRLIAHVVTATTTAWDVKFDNFFVGPNKDVAVNAQTMQNLTFTNIARSNVAFKEADTSKSYGAGIFSLDASTGTITVLKKALFNMSATNREASGTSRNSPEIQVDGVVVSYDTSDTGNNSTPSSCSYTQILNPNQTFKLFNNGSNVLTSGSVTAIQCPDTTSAEYSGRFHTAKCTNSGTLTLTVGGGANQKVNLCGTSIVNTTGMVNTASQRIDILESGFYNAVINLSYANVTVNVDVYTVLYKNGVQLYATVNRNNITTTVHTHLEVSSEPFSKGDYLEVYTWSADASYNVNVDDDYNNFTVTKIANPVDVVKSNEDVRAEYYGNGGTGITADSTDITFNTKTYDTHSAWDGDQFTVPITGSYTLTGMVRFNTAIAASALVLYIGVTASKVITYREQTCQIYEFSTTQYFTKGQVVSLRLNRSVTLSNGTADHWIMIKKLN